jgi:hypothetical protein
MVDQDLCLRTTCRPARRIANVDDFIECFPSDWSASVPSFWVGVVEFGCWLDSREYLSWCMFVCSIRRMLYVKAAL